MDRLFAAPRDLPPNLESHRFWIWLQLILVRLYVRAVKGAEANFLYGLTRTGQVWLLQIGDTRAEHAAALARQAQQDVLKQELPRALTAALEGASLLTAHPGEGRDPGRQLRLARVGTAACACITGRALPPPDT